jgi:hypothetical protein
MFLGVLEREKGIIWKHNSRQFSRTNEKVPRHRCKKPKEPWVDKWRPSSCPTTHALVAPRHLKAEHRLQIQDGLSLLSLLLHTPSSLPPLKAERCVACSTLPSWHISPFCRSQMNFTIWPMYSSMLLPQIYNWFS